MLKPREAIRSLPSYHPPLAGRAGLRLDFNENTLGCSPKVLDCLQRLTADDLARYPEKRNAEQIVADCFEIPGSDLLLTNGVDEAIHLLCQTYLDPGDHALIVVPTYSMYRIYMMASGAAVTAIPTGPDFEFPFDELCSKIDERIKLIAIANPNNPTGSVVDAERLARLAAIAPSAAILIDEAYFEFYGQSALRLSQSNPNVFVARTFSKAYGLAGLRIGVLVGPPGQMPAVRRVCSPYNVNAVALACLPCALADREYLERYVEETLESRARLESILKNAGVPFFPSRANFLLVNVGATAVDAKRFSEQMRAGGILVRDRSSDHGCAGCVRITLGLREHTDRLLATIQEAIDDLRLAEGATRS